ncbi:MAG TPA: response regulator transcription factor [Acidobacteriaceae bacterium]
MIVDDDVRLCDMLRDYLARHEIILTARHEGQQGLEAAHTAQYELMLLDVTLPGIDGFEVLRRLRKFSDVCVILLTARGDAADRVRGLQLGADDYLPKPFDAEELVARIYAILRRTTLRSSSAVAAPAKPVLQRDGLTIDLASRTVVYRDVMLDLTNVEVALLEMFMKSPGVVLTREELVSRVFQRPFHPLDRSLDVYVSRLRRKLHSATPLGNHIKTIRSSGYLFSSTETGQHQFEAS